MHVCNDAHVDPEDRARVWHSGRDLVTVTLGDVTLYFHEASRQALVSLGQAAEAALDSLGEPAPRERSTRYFDGT